MMNKEAKESTINGLDIQMHTSPRKMSYENTQKRILSKQKMDTFLNKLASSEKIRTLKERGINPDSLNLQTQNINNTKYDSPSKELKLLDHDLGLEDYMASEGISLLGDNNIMNIPIGDIEKEIDLNNVNNQTELINGKGKSSKTVNDLDESKDNYNPSLYNSIQKKSIKKNFFTASMGSVKKRPGNNKTELNNSFQLRTQNNRTRASARLYKDNQTKAFENSKEVQMNNSMVISKPKAPTSFRKNRKTNNGDSLSSRIQAKPNKLNDKSNMGTIEEEYDYSKLLTDLHSIFGEELEYFDEELFFESLDDQSSRGLIKGLLILANNQVKKIKTLDMSLSKTKDKYQSDIKAKDNSIENLTKQLSSIHQNLKGIINETEPFHKKAAKSHKRTKS